jgi:hypothetical protein
MIHSSLPPRVATAAAGGNLDSAAPAELAAAVWKRVGGPTAVDQGKTALAVIGVFSLLIFGWRLSRRAEPEPDEE